MDAESVKIVRELMGYSHDTVQCGECLNMVVLGAAPGAGAECQRNAFAFPVHPDGKGTCKFAQRLQTSPTPPEEVDGSQAEIGA